MIGIFDSGSGGLTVLHRLREVLPSADVTYFGDITNAPYGSKSQEELSRLTIDALKLLKGRGASRIISACNSTSASLALSLYDAFDMPADSVIEMVGPTVARFRGSTERIVLCATPATVRSGIYQNAFRMIGKDIAAVPVEGLAGSIEFGTAQEEQHRLIEAAFQEIDWNNFDTLILACTHYPLSLELFRELVPGKVAIFDPAFAVAQRAEKLFWPQEVGDGKTTFLISKDSAHFRALVSRLFPGMQYGVEVID